MCPGAEGITTQVLKICEEISLGEITYALWNEGELVKKTTSFSTFLSELKNYTLKANVHKNIKNIQKEEIIRVKEEAKLNPKKLVFHVDFAENWSVIFPNEIQSAYWKTKQISIFTVVCYNNGKPQSFAVVADDTKHDSVHAMLALNMIQENCKEQLELEEIEETTILSDGAAAHFKNRFQFFEFSESNINKQWIFSATGHGKGACDGIGGIVKHFASTHNLQKSHLQVIDSAESFVREVQNYTPSIKLLLISSRELEKFRKGKIRQWKSVEKIAGIQKCHVWKIQHNENGDMVSYMARTAKHDLVEI